jgi:hypothetical protein
VFNDNTQWVPSPFSYFAVPSGFHFIRHPVARQGGHADNRKVPVKGFPRVAVQSLYVFGATEEPVLSLSQVLPWFPKPHFRVRENVEAFRNNYLPHKIVGIHMRRTDHRGAIISSPDSAFIAEADRVLQEGFELFLATDNAATLNMMKQRYGSKLHSAPKSSERAERWPRRDFVLEDLLDDMVDLFLLAACDYVIGSAGSSYSEVAVALNGNARSHVVELPMFS